MKNTRLNVLLDIIAEQREELEILREMIADLEKENESLKKARRMLAEECTSLHRKLDEVYKEQTESIRSQVRNAKGG